MTRKGLRVNRIWYTPDDAADLTIGESYTIAYDPSDLRCIHIILSDRACPCHTAGVGHPLSAYEADAAYESAKVHTQTAQMKETAVSITAMQAIRTIVEQADSRKEPIRQINGDKIEADKLTEGRRLT